MGSSGNVIRVLTTERVGQAAQHGWSIIVEELNGQAFVISGGLYDLISKTSPFTKKVDGRAVAILPAGNGFQGTVTVGDTDTTGEFLLLATLTMDNGDVKFVVQDWTIEDAEALAQVP